MTILFVAQPLRIRQIRVDHDERIELFSLVVRKRSQADLGLLQGLPESKDLHLAQSITVSLRSRWLDGKNVERYWTYLGRQQVVPRYGF